MDAVSMQATESQLLRRTLLAGIGGAAVTWAHAGWGMVNPMPHDGPLRPTNGAFALPDGAGGAQDGILSPQPRASPIVPRRVSHPARYSAEALAEWAHFKARFMSGDGRVVDTGNGGVSHSEGQGWGMLFAVAFDDPETFDALHAWTRRTLRRRGDALHAWRYVPNAAQPVADTNNATDADLFIAAALWRAAWRWGRPELAEAAAAIARDLLALAVCDVGARTLLLPGVEGFASAAAVTINPSYYAFPMLDEMAALAPSPRWAQVRTHGMALLSEARFGRWQLPPDWLRVDRATGALAPHPNWPARFSYDAIRVPLWLSWANDNSSSAVQSFSSYWASCAAFAPAWIDLKTDDSATYPAPPGMVAVARIATALSQCGAKAPLQAGFPDLRASPDYYSAALILLTRLAWQEGRST
jgi:endoglucanase